MNDESIEYVEPERRIPVAGEYDLIIVGGSQSGVAAAISAARHGIKNVLLVERNFFLGGQSVATMVVQWEMRAFTNHLGAVCTRGIAKEMLDRIVEKGNSDGLWSGPYGCPEMRDGEEWLDVEAVKITLLQMCLEANVKLLLDTLCVGTVTGKSETGTPRVNGIIVENKSGRQVLTAKMVIDATAYLDIVNDATSGEGVIVRPEPQRMTPGWYTVFGGINSERFVDYLLEKRNVTGYPAFTNPDKVREHVRVGKLLKYSGFADILDEAFDDGLLDDWPEQFSLPIQLNVKFWGKDRWCTSIDPFRSLDALDAWALSRAEVDRQLVDWKLFQVFKKLPGWEHAYMARSSIRLGLRETRILKAEHMLSRDDIFSPDHDRADAIGRSGAHDPGKKRLWEAYPIPYGIIVPEKLDGILCCTRTIGAADKTALDAHRGITPTIVVGQAAGTAAAVALNTGVEPRDVNIERVRELLRADDVVLDMETVKLDTIPESYLSKKS